MTDNVYCTVSLPEQANEAITRMRLLGFEPGEVIVANQPSEVEGLIRTESEMTRSTLIGVACGFLTGVIMGFAQLAYMGHGVWKSPDLALIPVFNGFGWALVGSIIGCGGIFGRRKVPTNVEHHYEELVSKAKLLVAVPLHNRKELPAVRATLLDVGASNIYYTGDAA